MLKWMRDNSHSFIIYVLFGILVLVFAIQFNPGSGGCTGPATDYAARVNGEDIRRTEFLSIYSQRLESMRRSGAIAEGAEETVEKETRKMAIDQLIDALLVAQEAKRLGLKVTDEDLREYLERTLRVDEVEFSDYENFVQRRFGVNVTTFEEDTRQDVVAQRLSRIINDNITISDEELKQKFIRDRDRIQVNVVRFVPNLIEVPEPSKEQVDKLLAEDMDAVKARYEKDVFNYRTPKAVHGRHIMKAIPPGASDATIAAARNQLTALKAQLEGGADFAALAAAESDDADSKTKGGDLGWIVEGLQVGGIADPLFKLKTNEISDVVESKEGLHIVQAVEIKPPGNKPLEDVKEDVAKSILRGRVQLDIARERANALLEKLKAGESIEALTMTRDEYVNAEEKARTANEPFDPSAAVRLSSPWFARTQKNVPGIGESEELHDVVFALTKENPTPDKTYEFDDHVFVVQLKDKELPDLAKFEEEKEQLHNQAVWTKRTKLQREWIDQLRKRATIQFNPEIFPDTDAASEDVG